MSQKFVLALLWYIALSCAITKCEAVVTDETTCMTDFEDGDDLHFLCFCDDTQYKDNVASHARSIADHEGFSLAQFAYNLAGNYFGKSVFLTFQACRHIKLVLDHMELSRLGSPLFRPDIQVRRLAVEQVSIITSIYYLIGVE